MSIVHRRHARNNSLVTRTASSILSSPSSTHSNDIRSSFESLNGRSSLDTRGSYDPDDDPTRQRFVVTDPIAFRFLQDDPSIKVVDRHAHLVGYESYVVEQWATSRAHPTFVITTHTGDPSDRIAAGVLSVPLDEQVWSHRLRAYLQALNNKCHARRRETPLGIIMVVSLSSFPSSLTVIRILDGDLARCRVEFLVNENLKRLSCSGRIGLTFQKPNAATAAKFHQLYHTSDTNPLFDSVLDLVKLCQAALHLFGFLSYEYIDGFLCDLTERAINKWWLVIGTEIYTIESHDGILGPTTVAALLGCLLGARNRLHALNVSVPKDPFNLDEMKRAISRFQKSRHLARSRRLDRDTLLQLHHHTAKAAHSAVETWRVPKAVKSTVAELSGKGGEMLADAVGRRDKAGIAEIETTDIATFRELIYGERCKWMWNGKPLKRLDPSWHGESAIEGRLIMRDDQKTFTWTALKSTPAPRYFDSNNNSPFRLTSMHHRQRTSDSPNDTSTIPRVKKRATELINEGRHGLDRFRDAVHLRGHHPKSSVDESPSTPPRPNKSEQTYTAVRRPSVPRAYTSPSVEVSPTKDSTRSRRDNILGKFTALPSTNQDQPSSKSGASATSLTPEDNVTSNTTIKPPIVPPSIKTALEQGSNYNGVNINEALPGSESAYCEHEIGPLLRRTQSHSHLDSGTRPPLADRLPRHLSFSFALDALYARKAADDDWQRAAETIADFEPSRQLALETSYTTHLQSLRADIAQISKRERVWTERHLDDLAALCARIAADAQFLEQAQSGPASELQDIKDRCAASIHDLRELLGESRREIETQVSKLDYEIANLRGKLEDIELGVRDFAEGVAGAEQRTDELERSHHDDGWTCTVS